MQNIKIFTFLLPVLSQINPSPHAAIYTGNQKDKGIKYTISTKISKWSSHIKILRWTHRSRRLPPSLRLIPRIHVVEGEKRLFQFVLWHPLHLHPQQMVKSFQNPKTVASMLRLKKKTFKSHLQWLFNTRFTWLSRLLKSSLPLSGYQGDW